MACRSASHSAHSQSCDNVDALWNSSSGKSTGVKGQKMREMKRNVQNHKKSLDTFGSSGVLEWTPRQAEKPPFFATLSKDRCSWLSDDHPPPDQWDDLELWNHLAMGSPSHQFEEAFHMDFPMEIGNHPTVGRVGWKPRILMRIQASTLAMNFFASWVGKI